jgi:hypothetical protein
MGWSLSDPLRISPAATAYFAMKDIDQNAKLGTHDIREAQFLDGIATLDATKRISP